MKVFAVICIVFLMIVVGLLLFNKEDVDATLEGVKNEVVEEVKGAISSPPKVTFETIRVDNVQCVVMRIDGVPVPDMMCGWTK